MSSDLSRVMPNTPEEAAAAPHVEAFRRDGFAVVKKVFSRTEVAQLARAFDRIYDEGLRHPRSFRHGNTLFRIAHDPVKGRVVRYVQWPSYFDPLLDSVRRDQRMVRLLEPLIGNDVKQIINQMHWKPPGARAEFAYHQDIRFRRPRGAYRQPGESYVQTGIAIDPHRPDNGAMVVYPGSHGLGELAITPEGARVMDSGPDDSALGRVGLDPSCRQILCLDPGDVALWHLYLVHGSGPNSSTIDRRLYINGYVRADRCDRGVWTFRNGASVPLGPPVLIHYEDLFLRPDPHYLDD